MQETNAIVVGGQGQIGRAVVAALLERGGTRVWSLDLPSAAPVDAAVTAIAVDLRDDGALAAAVADLPARIDVYVNTVGGERRPAVAPVTDATWPPPQVWADIHDLNTGLAYRVLRAVQDRLAPGASATHVSSIAGAMPWVVSPAYGAAKAALEHWTSTLAVHLAPRGIRVNAVRPGFVWSRQWAAVDRAEFDAVVADRVPLAQFAADEPVGKEQQAEDVAAVVAFLSSDGARHLTGQIVDVDGGARLVRAAR